MKTAIFNRDEQSSMMELPEAIQAQGLERSRLDIEADYLTVTSRAELAQLLPEPEVVASDTQFEWIRALKTPEEIALLKREADILDDAILDAFSSARVGDTEWEIHCRILSGAEARGAEHCRGALACGANADTLFSGVSQHILKPGDLVWTDYAVFLVLRYSSNDG
jgi:Xaa-Pro dipeptidase